MADQLDGVARGLAQGISRRKALKTLGIGMGGAALAAFMPAAASGARRECPPGRSTPCGTGCCPVGTTCCPKDGRAFCCQGTVTLCPITIGALETGCIEVL